MATKKGAGKGTGGHGRRRLEGKGPTPPAKERTGHPAQRRAAAAARRNVSARGARGRRDERPDVVVGRNPVVEALRARVPATAMYVLASIDTDDRVVEAVRAAGDLGIPLLEVGKPELDRLSGRAVHQGLALAVPPYSYADPADLLARALESPAPLLVALDGVTDPHNLGAVVRSAAAFGAQGVVVPERRAAGMTAVAWKASAGAAARLPVARATNLVRALTSYADAGLLVVGLAAGGDVTLDDFEAATDPLVLVVGSEGRGLSRLVAERCDLRVAIPMAAGTESLNASVAAGVALAEIARRRRR
ncbi:MAG TPA: 23S rRNA (guanosine(2251)-2'-O)-methyltransferase RlmB [Mycobacteriales bacterium]|jgi:23S rRNA (guanosine2251-2'-O)-methyltransferase|nr:23S rRNA (guanosine(2251)-2'-O)-methyltransferase RlmB [Mycobacteriales bacterium]